MLLLLADRVLINTRPKEAQKGGALILEQIHELQKRLADAGRNQGRWRVLGRGSRARGGLPGGRGFGLKRNDLR